MNENEHTITLMLFKVKTFPEIDRKLEKFKFNFHRKSLIEFKFPVTLFFVCCAV